MRAQRCRIELLGIELRLWEAEGSREMHLKQTAPLFHPLDHLRAMELDGDGYVLDVGASIGHWAVFVALLFPRVFESQVRQPSLQPKPRAATSVHSSTAFALCSNQRGDTSRICAVLCPLCNTPAMVVTKVYT